MKAHLYYNIIKITFSQAYTEFNILQLIALNNLGNCGYRIYFDKPVNFRVIKQCKRRYFSISNFI